MAKSLFLWPLLLCSLVAVAVVVHRALSLRQSAVIPLKLVRVLENAELPAGDAKTLLAENESSLAVIAKVAVLEPHDNRAAAMEATESTAREEVIRLHAGLSMLEVIITIAPLLGLLGTVSGLVTVFSGFGDASSPASRPISVILSRGISEALVTTIVGLAIAVPTVVAHGYFQRKIERLAARMEVIFQRVLERRYAREKIERLSDVTRML